VGLLLFSRRVGFDFELLALFLEISAVESDFSRGLADIAVVFLERSADITALEIGYCLFSGFLEIRKTLD
jgi:hypothetical protein